MKSGITERTSLYIAVAALVAVLVGAWLVVTLTPTANPHVVRIGKAITLAPVTVGGGSSPPVPGYFTRALAHHRWCGAPVSVAIRGSHGIFRQHFQHCDMAIGPVSVARFPAVPSGPPTPRPTQIPTSLPTATPYTPPLPTATPLSVASPTPLPAPAQSPPSSPVQYELYLMNQSRASLGLPAYSLNPTQSSGTASCVGSYGHALHMSQAGTISHDQFPADICVAVRAAGENVGEAYGYSAPGALDVIHTQMMAEPIGPGIQNHHTSIISTQFTQVGIGVVTSGNYTYMCVDFLG